VAGVKVTCPQVFGAGQSPQPVQIQSQTIGRWVAQFDIFDKDGSFSPQLGQTVQITEGGLRLFGGCLDSIQLDLLDGTLSWATPLLVYHCTAVDKSGILDRRVLLQGFASGLDGAAIIQSMWTDSTYCNPPIQQEGITRNGVAASVGLTTSPIVKQLPTVRTVLDDLCTDLGLVWFLDSTGDLNVQAIADLGTCPYSLTNTSANFRHITMTSSLLEYATKDYAISDRVVTPASPATTGPGGTLTTETYTLPQQAAVDRGFILGSIITNYAMNKIVSLKVNGVAQPVYLGTQTPNISFRHTWWYFAQTNYLYPPSVQGFNPFPDPAAISADPSIGDVIEIQYLAPTQQSAVVPGDPLAPTSGTCGTGTYEVVEQVKGITLQADLDAIATAALAKRNVIPKSITFETDQPGAVVGQRLTVNIPRLDLASTSLLITGLSGIAQSGKLQYASRFRWTVTATNTQDFGNWAKWFERFLARTENALAIPRYEPAQFILGNGTSLSAGIVSMNPYPVKNSGTVILTTAVANTPPIGQQLDIEIISDAQGFVSRISIPDSSTALHQTTATVSSPAPFVLYAGDILRVSVAYSSPGINPTPATDVTVELRISY
jgi:hypothetical protein